jgi:hypothetical protein
MAENHPAFCSLGKGVKVPERTSSDSSPSSVEAKNGLNNTSRSMYYFETYTAATLSFIETRAKDHIDRPHLHLSRAVIFPVIFLSNASSDLSFLRADITPWQPSLEKTLSVGRRRPRGLEGIE